MIEIANLEEWTKEYFSDPENQKKAEKACERYDRLMVKNIKRQLSAELKKSFSTKNRQMTLVSAWRKQNMR